MQPLESEAAKALLAHLGRTVRARREHLGFTRAQLAKRAKLSPRFLAAVEAGDGNISVVRLLALCEALHLAPAEVLSPESPTSVTPKRVVALLGLRGAGKSTLGRRLAPRLRADFVELGDLVEQRAGFQVGEIFDWHGETHFRRLEQEALAALLDSCEDHGGRCVLAAGGGAVMWPETLRLLQQRCVTVWVHASAQAHLQRVLDQGDERPVANRPAALRELQDLLEERRPLYERSDWSIDTTGMPVDRCVDWIALRVEPVLGD